MKKNLKSYWVVALALAALSMGPVVNGQGGGKGGGGKAAKAVTNNPPPTSPVSGNATTGKALYSTFGCYACHGFNGETGARPFVGRWGNLATEQGFVTFLRARANVAPVPPSTGMPSFSEASMSDRQAKDIYAYIRTFKSSAPELKDIPTLNAIVEAAKQDKK